MKKTSRILLTSLLTVICVVLFVNTALSQTKGTLTLTYTQTAASANATKNVLAVWIEDGNGTFVKTRARFWGNNTKDHLPSWVSKSAQSTVDAATGATRTSSSTPKAFGQQTFTWNGTNGGGTVVTDGTYKIVVESAWCNPEPANNQHKFISTFTFVKGISKDSTSPTDVNLSGVSVVWTPDTSTASVENIQIEKEITVFPNPSKGVINLEFSELTNVSKITVEDITGKVVLKETVKQSIEGLKTINLDNCNNGIYVVKVYAADKQLIRSEKVEVLR